ncbi:MAG TPA: pyridoxal phosphate-dependent aminotransferase [Candidatus Acidoferrum sp.]|nr:pyridoxal phosphate-dependent aminotransferase [Candidatus Acidoferrum sp.]
MSANDSLLKGSRRSFLQWSAAAAAASAFHIVNEPMLAAAAVDRDFQHFPPGSVVINANENPLGPCYEARKALTEIIPQGGRYCWWLKEELTKLLAQTLGVKPEYVAVFPGSSEPLHFSVLAFTSPTRSYVTADPGYESGMNASKFSGARVVKTALTKSFGHDISAMLSAAPDAGLFYVCTPNNPTGTVTPHSDIEELVAKKPKDSVVLVDEAYIHFSDATTALDLVNADKDVIVLRTFSKIYGMAGLRCGAAIARPELLQKLIPQGGGSAMPVTALVAAAASLRHQQLVPDRKSINTQIREKTFDWLKSQGYSFTPSQANFFMLDGKRPAKQVIDALAAQKVFIGRIWPVWPTHLRITVGTQQEMDAFQTAFAAVMKNSASVSYALPANVAESRRDGLLADGTLLTGLSS